MLGKLVLFGGKWALFGGAYFAAAPLQMPHLSGFKSGRILGGRSNCAAGS
jgi:hypothetical protein